MMEGNQLRALIVSTLKHFNVHSTEAVDLLMMTAAVESDMCKRITQMGHGPALGIFQMEPRTERWVKSYLLKRRPLLAARIIWACGRSADNLRGNLVYQIIMARVYYMTFKEAIPTTTTEALAWYWKTYWNTMSGAGTVNKAVIKYNLYCR